LIARAYVLQFVTILLQNYIFFGDSNEPRIYIYEKSSLNNISSYLLRDSGGITDMAMYASDAQPSTTS